MRRGRIAGRHAGRRPQAGRHARGARAALRRLRLQRVPGHLRHGHGLRPRVDRRLPAAFITNNGPLDPAGSVKATHFIQQCCQNDLAIVYLQNTTGYIVGRESERGGMIKHGSKMIQAVACASVPQVTIHCGASFGAGNYGMCGRGFAPRFLFSWPNARTAVMGAEQAAGTMAIVMEASAREKASSPTARRSTVCARRSSRRSSDRPRRSTRRVACSTTASSIRATRGACSRTCCTCSAAPTTCACAR